MTRLLAVLIVFAVITLIVQAVWLHRGEQRTRSIIAGTIAAVLVLAGIAMLAAG
jgi:hypothetical protein